MTLPTADRPRSLTRRRTAWGYLTLALLAAIGLISLGVLVGDAINRPDEGPAPPVTVVAERRDLVLDYEAIGSAELGGFLTTIYGQASGTFTRIDISPGDVIEVRDPLFSIDGSVSIAADLETPLWRSITIGDSGADVQMVEDFLARLGLDPGKVNDRFTSATSRAVRQLQVELGSPETGVVQPGMFVVAEWPQLVVEVTAELGAPATHGAAIATLRTGEKMLVFSLPATAAAYLRLGDVVEVAAIDGRLQEAPIVGIGEAGSTDLVLITVVHPDSSAPAGQPATVRAVLQRADQVVAIPAAALFTVGGEATVQVLAEDGSESLRVVEVGLLAGGFVEIVSGIEQGELVVIPGG